jgi:hypothetical protein
MCERETNKLVDTLTEKRNIKQLATQSRSS